MFKKLLNMKYSWLYIMMVIGVLLMSVTSYAQTLTTNEPAPQKAWEIVLKIMFPALWTVGAPWLTGIVTMGISHVPAPLRIVISSVLGAIIAGAAGVIPDFPLTIESAATMGLAGGATGQVLANLHPDILKPKTDAAIVVIEANKKVS